MTSTGEQLKILMTDWKRKQCAKSGMCGGIECNISGFAPDGLIGEYDEWDKLPEGIPKVLYVLPEPNWSKDDYKEDYFWFREVVHSNIIGGDKRVRGRHILPKLALAQHFFETGAEQFVCNDYERLKNAAYMNLSKIGSGSCRNAADRKRLQDYVANYKAEIQEEIRILNPDIIVCMGCGVYGHIDCLLMGMRISPLKIICWHPSAVESYENFFRRLQQAYPVGTQ